MLSTFPIPFISVVLILLIEDMFSVRYVSLTLKVIFDVRYVSLALKVITSIFLILLLMSMCLNVTKCMVDVESQRWYEFLRLNAVLAFLF